ncbi:hypothetical protein [Brevundimonas sp.]|uniref:hypothetical protein n=1 Tax=Brevundimonas sp. TaxID=1871086 RepID=UPI0035158807
MSRLPWTDEERAWAVECLTAGDTYEEVAAWSGRTVVDVERTIALPRLSDRQREVLALLAVGYAPCEIDDLTGRDGARHRIRIIRALGYAVPTPGRLSSDEVKAIARAKGFENLKAFATAYGIPASTMTHVNSRGLPAWRLREARYAQA